jgi:hypothetical protein
VCEERVQQPTTTNRAVASARAQWQIPRTTKHRSIMIIHEAPAAP